MLKGSVVGDDGHLFFAIKGKNLDGEQNVHSGFLRFAAGNPLACGGRNGIYVHSEELCIHHLSMLPSNQCKLSISWFGMTNKTRRSR